MPWIHSSIRSKLPRTAIAGGRDIHGHTIYIGRTQENDTTTLPCFIIPYKRVAYTIDENDQVIYKDDYEVLCGDTYHWEADSFGDAPTSSLIGGKTSIGEEIFIGRVEHEGALLPGLLIPSRNVLVFAVDTKVIEVEEYEVLVLKRQDSGRGLCKSCAIS